MRTETRIETAELRLIPRSADVMIHAGGCGKGRYTARFRGSPPAIHEDGDTVTIRFPRVRRGLRRPAGELRLDPSLAWTIRIDGGASNLVADLSGSRSARWRSPAVHVACTWCCRRPSAPWWFASPAARAA